MRFTQVTVSPTFDWMCSISYVISNVCYTVKFLDSLCEFFEFINESIFGAIQNSKLWKTLTRTPISIPQLSRNYYPNIKPYGVQVLRVTCGTWRTCIMYPSITNIRLHLSRRRTNWVAILFAVSLPKSSIRSKMS